MFYVVVCELLCHAIELVVSLKMFTLEEFIKMQNLVLPEPTVPSSPAPDPSIVQPITEAALELRRIELREKEIEWEREKTLLEADRQAQRERERREHELRVKYMEIAQAIRLKELDIKAGEAGVNWPSHTEARRVTHPRNTIPVCGYCKKRGHVLSEMHHISLFSDLVTSNVTLGVRPSLPVKGISMLLGNDLAGGNVLPSPVCNPHFSNFFMSC